VEPDSWRFWASWGAFVLVCVTFAAAWVVLASFGASLNKERKRRDAALARLPLVFEIHGKIRENYFAKAPIGAAVAAQFLDARPRAAH
jgi:hypothetical protein